MARINLIVDTETSAALQKIREVEKAAKSLEKSHIKVNVDTTPLDKTIGEIKELTGKTLQIKVEAKGVDAATKSLIQLAKKQAEASKEAAKAAREERKLEQERRKTERATEATKQKERELEKQREITKRATEKSAQAESDATKEIAKARQIRERANLELANAAKEYQRFRAEKEKGINLDKKGEISAKEKAEADRLAAEAAKKRAEAEAERDSKVDEYRLLTSPREYVAWRTNINESISKTTNLSAEAASNLRQELLALGPTYRAVSEEVTTKNDEWDKSTVTLRDNLGETIKVVQSATGVIDTNGKAVYNVTKIASGSIEGTNATAQKAAQQISEEAAKIAGSYKVVSNAISQSGGEWTKTTTTIQDELGNTYKLTAQYSGEVDNLGNKMIKVSSTMNEAKTALSEEQKSLLSNQVTAKALSDEYGELIDHREKMVDGMVVESLNKYRDAMGNVTTVTAKLHGEVVQVTKTVETNSEKLKKQADAAELAAKRNTLLGDSLDRIIAKIIAWQVLNGAVATVIRSFRNAVDTIREVDTQLTNIQKVSNLSSAEIKALGDSAYDAASKFGVAADEYLKAVYTFQKAGLGDSATDMADLATKTMLVGDTTADVASKFLIAVNAAWDLKGNIEALNGVIDSADYINNNYATDLEKLADSMPIVASTAANMNMSIEETFALLATGTAKTQDTGRKFATAARSFMIALSGQVGEFVDDLGETYDITTESVESLADALNNYGNAAVRHAKETGEIINPMEALNSLAQAYKDNLLTDMELEGILLKVAGKMRYNALVTIVKDLASETSTYRDILSKLPEAAGTADAEVGIMLSSWESKTQILQNTWTKFVSHFVDTNFVKGAVDFLTAIVRLMDTAAGRFATIAALFGTVIKTIQAATKMKVIADLAKTFTALTTAVTGATSAVGAFTAAWAVSPFAVIALGAVAVMGVVAAVDALTVSYKEQEEKLQQINAEYDKQFGNGSEYAKLIANVDSLTEAEKRRLLILQQQEEVMRHQREEEEKRTVKKWLEENSRGGNYFLPFGGSDSSLTKVAINLYNIREELDTVSESYEKAETTQEGYKKGLVSIVGEYEEYYNGIIKAKEYGEELTEQESEFVSLYEIIANEASRTGKIVSSATETQKKTVESISIKLKTQSEIYGELKEKVEPLVSALSEMNSKGAMTDKVMESLIEQYPELERDITLTKDGWVVSTEAIENHIKALSTNYDTIYNNATSAAQQLVSSEEAKQAGFNATTGSIYEQIRALAALYATNEAAARSEFVSKMGGDNWAYSAANQDSEVMRWHGLSTTAQNALVSLENAEKNANRAKGILSNLYGGVGKSKSGSGSGSYGSTKDEWLEHLKNQVAAEKERLELLQKQGASAEVQAEQMKKIQDVLHEQADYLRDINPDWENNAEIYSQITSLSSEWYDWQEKITKLPLDSLKETVSLEERRLSFMQASGASAEDQVAQMKKIQDALHEQAEYMRSIGASEEDVLALSEKWWKLNKDIDGVFEDIIKKAEDAQKELNKLIEAAFSEMSNALKTNEEKVLSPLEQELENLEKQRDARKQATEESEKLLAVEKARIALQNAQNERTIRAYNKRTGQWEWVADAKAIQKAEEDLAQANKALEDFREEQTITSVKNQIKQIETAYGEINNAIKYVADQIKNGAMTYQEAYAYIGDKMHQIYNDYGVNLTGVLDSANKNLMDSLTRVYDMTDQQKATIAYAFQKLAQSITVPDSVKTSLYEAVQQIINSGVNVADNVNAVGGFIQTALQTNNPATAIKELSDAIKNGVVNDLSSVGTVLDALNGKYTGISQETAKILALTKMQANSIAWHMTTDAATRQNLQAENQAIGSQLGLTFNPYSGSWTDSSGNAIYSVSATNGSASTSLTPTGISYASNGTSSSTRTVTTRNGVTGMIIRNGQIVGYTYSNPSSADSGTDYIDTSDMNFDEIVDAVRENQYIGNSGQSGIVIENGQIVRTHDMGGILHGIGSIKATAQDEIVLPPDMTRKLLTAETNGVFDDLLCHLGIVTSAAQKISQAVPGHNTNTIGTQNNGDSFYFNGIEVKNVTDGTTMGEFVRKVRNLSLYSGRG